MILVCNDALFRPVTVSAEIRVHRITKRLGSEMLPRLTACGHLARLCIEMLNLLELGVHAHSQNSGYNTRGFSLLPEFCGGSFDVQEWVSRFGCCMNCAS